jgi:glycosyltransferase involved in cell wall biosynthesis
MTKVSVVIPAYNSMHYLPATLDTVLKQSFEDYEVIIVDDGSTDHIGEWAAGVNDSRVKLITQVNQGPSIARNTGIAQAQGDYVAFLDADDLWESTKLEKQVEILDRQPEIGLVYTWIIQTDKEGNSTGRLFKFYDEGQVWERMLLRNFIACGSTPMIRRVCFEEVGNFDPDLFGPEDNDMWLRIAAKYKFAVVKEPLVYYRQLNSSVSRNLEKMERSWKIMHAKAFANAPDHLTPTNLEKLERQSYGLKYVYLAWRALQSKDKNYRLAIAYSQKAVSYDPSVLISHDFIRLHTLILIIRVLGFGSFEVLRDSVYKIRGRLRRIH